MVPIWVSEPIGSARPFLIANTPAMVVVATAPRPTSSTPSLPRAGATSSGGVTIGHYIMRKCACFCAKRALAREPLAVTMSGVRLGERALQIGDGDARCDGPDCGKDRAHRNAAIVVPDEHAAARVRRAIDDVGALVDVRVVDQGMLPFDDAAFDVIVVHDVPHTIVSTAGTRPRWMAAASAVALLRSGGRIVTIERGAPVGLRALFGGGSQGAASGSGRGHDGNARFRRIRGRPRSG